MSKKHLPVEAEGKERGLTVRNLPASVERFTPAGEVFVRGLFMALTGGAAAAGVAVLAPGGGAAAALVGIGAGTSVGFLDVAARRWPRRVGLAGLRDSLTRHSVGFWALHLVGMTLATATLALLPWAFARVFGIMGRDLVALVSEEALATFLSVAVVVGFLAVGALPEVLMLPLLAALRAPPEGEDPPALPPP